MKKRIIARLDVKGPNVIKGIQFECLRVMGKPRELAEEYYLQGADELIYLDIVANLYRRQNLINIVNQASEDIFIPFTIGGGIRSVEDIRALLNAGADKVAINTAATKRPELLKEAAETFGSQCIVLSIEAKKKKDGTWEAYTDNGRESTGLDVIEWARKAESLGAGEIFLTSVDKEGTEQGYDVDLVREVSSAVSIPVIAGGGASSEKSVVECLKEGSASAAAIGSLLHYKKTCVSDIKDLLEKNEIPVRRISDAKRPELKKGSYDTTNYNKYTQKHIETETDLHGKSKIEDLPLPDNFKIGIINYGINNVKSVYNALRKIGKQPGIITTPEQIEKSEALILPGVGAFGKGMAALRDKGLIEPIRKAAEKGVPILGICLGMQMLFSESEEFGLHKGLDLIPGRVVKLKDPKEVGLEDYRLPHIGWNELLKTEGGKDWNDTSLNETKDHDSVYFVHSFVAVPKSKEDILANAEYGEQEFCVAAKRGNISGLQFHPEKSGQIGIKMLDSFCKNNNL